MRYIVRGRGKREVARDSIRTGERGVLLVMEELLHRGVNPYKPAVDDHGVDLMLLNGLRIQVKAAHLSHSDSKYPLRSRNYIFSCAKNTFGSGYRRVQNRRIFSDECDFVLFVGLDQRRFWIVPSPVVDAHGDMSIIMRECDDPPTLQKINEMLSKGMLKTEVAKELGCCETTIWKRGKGFRERNSKVRYLRSFEDRWDLLDRKSAVHEFDSVPNFSSIYERDPGFAGTLAGPISVAA